MNSAGVRIDTAIAQFGANRYRIANISSYQTAETFESKTTTLRICSYCVLFLVFCAWVLVGHDLWDGKERIIFYVGFVGSLVFVDSLPMRKIFTYTLFLSSSGGEQQVFSTDSSDEMNRIEKELREAISNSVGRAAQVAE